MTVSTQPLLLYNILECMTHLRNLLECESSRRLLKESASDCVHKYVLSNVTARFSIVREDLHLFSGLVSCRSDSLHGYAVDLPHDSRALSRLLYSLDVHLLLDLPK